MCCVYWARLLRTQTDCCVCFNLLFQALKPKSYWMKLTFQFVLYIFNLLRLSLIYIKLSLLIIIRLL